MAEDRPRILRWWEGLSPQQNLAYSAAPFLILWFLINWLAFQQPVLRSLVYCVIEGGLTTGLLAVATQTERSKRRPGGGGPGAGG